MPGFNPEGIVAMMSIIVDLYFFLRRLGIMQKMFEQQQEIANRAITTAEALYAVEEEVRALDVDYFSYADSMPTYTPQYTCAMDRANAAIIRKVGVNAYRQMKTTDAYSIGLRRDIAETAMGEVALQSGPGIGTAWMLEDKLADATEQARVSSRLHTLGMDFFAGADALRSLSASFGQQAREFGASATAYLQSAAQGVGFLIAGGGQTQTPAIKLFNKNQIQGPPAPLQRDNWDERTALRNNPKQANTPFFVNYQSTTDKTNQQVSKVF